MTLDDRIEKLLIEIRDDQRAHLEEYRRAAEQSLEVQRQSFESQARHIRMYRQIALVGFVIIAALIGYVVWLGLSLT